MSQTPNHSAGSEPRIVSSSDGVPGSAQSKSPLQTTSGADSSLKLNYQPTQPIMQQEPVTYMQNYPTSFNLGHMTSSLPASPHSHLSGPGFAYNQRLDTQPNPYYQIYTGDPGSPPRPGYSSPIYGPFQEQWMQGSVSPRYGQGPYGAPPPPHHPSPYPSLTTISTQSAHPGFQYSQYGDQRQLYSTAGSGSSVAGLQKPVAAPSDPSVQTVPRGPPRKPRQSGHALWVGNLPQSATVMDLKDHFSRGAKTDIESVKLISKSNCAFVNYRTHDACAAAMERFHDSKFHGTRLVCRLRRTLPFSPTATSPSVDPPSPAIVTSNEGSDDGATSPSPNVITVPDPVSRRGLKDRFFVLKSLTFHDLEISTRTGMWATQAHNEDTLNDAFACAENVYLFFSANKSGEYFGYARMASSIPRSSGRSSALDEQKNDIRPAEVPRPSLPSQNSPVPLEALPRAIVTPETEWAPKGRIIDDMARGTIFWEVDTDEDESRNDTSERAGHISHHTPSVEAGNDDQNDLSCASSCKLKESEPRSQAEPGKPLTGPLKSPVIAKSMQGLVGGDVPFKEAGSSKPATVSSSEASSSQGDGNGSGNSFHVEWIVVKKLPFYKCRGLRNPWNANREVKIARDGTEIETSIGERLMILFKA